MSAAVTSRSSTQSVVRVAWLERRVSIECAHGRDAPHQIEEIEIPAWFRDQELGLGFGHGPSIFWTAQNIERINRANLRQFRAAPGESDSPRQKVLRRLKLEKVSRSKLKRALARVGIIIRNGQFIDLRTGRVLLA